MTYTDLHTHGLAGHDARSKEPESYLKLAEAMKAHGTGAFLPTLFPGPVAEMRAQMEAVKRAMEMQGGDNAIILGVHLEGPFVNPNKSGALDAASFIAATPDNLARLIEGFEDVIRIMTVAPEMPGALGLIERLTALGVHVNMGHSDATYAQAAEGRKAGAVGVTHLFNAMSPLHHREPGLAGYALTDDALYVEVIADLVHVHPEMLRLVLKCKPPEKIILVSDSLGPAKTAGVPEDGPLYLSDGRTLAGSGITLGDAVRNMASLGVPPATAERFATVNPRRYLGMD